MALKALAYPRLPHLQTDAFLKPISYPKDFIQRYTLQMITHSQHKHHFFRIH